MIKNRCYAVAIAKRETELIYDPREYHFEFIPNGFNYWVADPFPIEINGELFVFGEMFEYSKHKGSIAYTKKTRGGFTTWKKIIEEPFHLSFPNIFYIDGDLFICPESHADKSLRLYKCIEFPEKWEFYKSIMTDVDCVDTVFLEKEKSVIGFTCEWNGISDHCLKIFNLDKKNGSYVFSHVNPSVVSLYMSRPAGKIIKEKNKLIMVSQICKPLYGSGLVFKEFEIDFPVYREKELFRVYPNEIECNCLRNFDGIHTYNNTSNYIAIDMIWTRFNFVEFYYKVKRKIISILK